MMFHVKQTANTTNNIEVFDRLTDYLLKENDVHNLTGIKDRQEIQQKHIADSLVLSDYIHTNHHGDESLCDLGTGCGFPALVLAIANKDLQVFALDSIAKKINFIKASTDLLAIKNLFPVCIRVEDYAKQVGSCFDLIVARSLARLDVLLEYASPLLKINGHFLAMKSINLEEELMLGLTVSASCGFKYVSSFEYVLGNQTRYIVSFIKTSEAQLKLPRKAGFAKKFPLSKKEANNG